jgi:hypothetical protein
VKWIGVSLTSVVFVAACATPAPTQPKQPGAAPLGTPSAAATPVEVQAAGRSASSAPVPVVRPLASPSPVALPLSVLAGRSGSDVRVALNLLFQEQLYLCAAAMDAASSARLDELIAVSGVLDQNSMALAEIVGAVQGEPAAQTLLDAWRGLVDDLVQYAQGQQSVASADLDRRRPVVAAQFAFAGLTAATADDLLRRHIQAQLILADALISHDSTQAAQRLRSAAAASDDLARPLAAAIAAQAPAQAPPPTEGLDVDVRIDLARLLQEHTYLTGAAVDAASDGRVGDQHALLGAANANATDLGVRLGAAYGPDIGNGLAERERAETASLVSVASGGDRAQAAAELARLRGELDGLLSTANQLLPPGLVSQQLRASGQPLLTAADAFSARDFGTAYNRLREAARQSQKAADSVALSLVDRYPGRYFVLPTPPPSP